MQSGGQAKSQVRFWAFGREGEATAELLRDFNTRYPDIEVEIQRCRGLPRTKSF